MLVSLLILSTTLQVSGAEPQAPADRGTAESGARGEAKTEVAAATPEQALRTFFVAMLTKDEKALRAVTLPTEDFDWLLRGPALPAERLQRAKEDLARQPIRVLKAGDEFTLPGGRKAKVRPEEVTADRAVLMPEGAPVPSRCQKVDGRWRVDATPIIAARKAAEAARKKAEPPK
jgi:hypothetical protein